MANWQKTSMLVILFVAAFASLACAQRLTVTTDQSVYQMGHTVEITIHNPTTNPVDLTSDPYMVIVHVASSTCVFGCIGLPVMTTFQPDETYVYDYDTSVNTDPAGLYRIIVMEAQSVPLPWTEPTTEYTLEVPTPNEMQSWSRVKSLYN